MDERQAGGYIYIYDGFIQRKHCGLKYYTLHYIFYRLYILIIIQLNHSTSSCSILVIVWYVNHLILWHRHRYWPSFPSAVGVEEKVREVLVGSLQITWATGPDGKERTLDSMALYVDMVFAIYIYIYYTYGISYIIKYDINVNIL